MKRRVERITITYMNGETFEIYRYQIEGLEKLVEAMGFMERAKNLYSSLKPIFDKELKKGR